jgi:hypothetical protein
MENRKQEAGNWKLVNVAICHFRFSVSCFSFPVSCSAPTVPGLAPGVAMGAEGTA